MKDLGQRRDSRPAAHAVLLSTLLLFVATCFPSVSRAQDGLAGADEVAVAELHPNAAETAEAMRPCLDDGEWIVHGARGSSVYADGSDDPVFTLTRVDPRDVAARDTGLQFWLDDDPHQPPLTMYFFWEDVDLPLSGRIRLSNCFEQAYRAELAEQDN